MDYSKLPMVEQAKIYLRYVKEINNCKTVSEANQKLIEAINFTKEVKAPAWQRKISYTHRAKVRRLNSETATLARHKKATGQLSFLD